MQKEQIRYSLEEAKAAQANIDAWWREAQARYHRAAAAFAAKATRLSYGAIYRILGRGRSLIDAVRDTVRRAFGIGRDTAVRMLARALGIFIGNLGRIIMYVWRAIRWVGTILARAISSLVRILRTRLGRLWQSVIRTIRDIFRKIREALIALGRYILDRLEDFFKIPSIMFFNLLDKFLFEEE